MNQIIISQSHWKKLQNHLLQDQNEHLAFFYANNYFNGDGTTFLVKDLVLVSDDSLDNGFWSLNLSTEKLLEIINKAKLENLALIEAHSHPFSNKNVAFSGTDLDGFKEFVPYVQSSLSKPYAGLVLGKNSVAGLCWIDTLDNKKLDRIVIIGEKYKIQSLTSDQKSYDKTVLDKYKRHSIFGNEVQKQLGKLKVAVVGLGGIGSHVVQQLAYLGVRNFILIDFDNVEKSNLNRLIGAFPSDIYKSKAEIAEHLICSICDDENVNIEKFTCELNDPTVLNSLKTTDFIFGCLDNDGGRLILNEFSRAFLKPYLDCGVGINPINEKLTEIGGRIVFVKPDSPCLQCAGEINNTEAMHFFQTDEEKKINKKLGYVQNFDVPSPSVVTLNGVVSSVATTEFFLYIVGKKRSFYLNYDANSQRLTERIIKKDDNCYACSLQGLGLSAEILERYRKRNF